MKVTSITLLQCLIGTLWSMSSAVAEPVAMPLPQLGNTNNADRSMSIEIADDHVFDPAQLPAGTPQSAGNLPASSPGVISGESSSDSGSQSTAAENSVWTRIRAANQLPLRDSDRAAFYRDQYRREAIWISKILHRAKPYLGYLVNTFDERYLPIELALLPAIESGFKPEVISAEDAAGIWQIVPKTAREMGMVRSGWFDGRVDIKASTEAAADYLRYLNAEFNGDWELSLAAYNAGLGRVRSAVQRNVKAGLPTTFDALKLPGETRNYVPKLVALLQLIKDPDFTDFNLPEIPATTAFDEVDTGKRISLHSAAKFADIPERELRRLNAGWIHGVTAPTGPHKLNVPKDAVERFHEALNQADKALLYSLPHTHEVQVGDSLSEIALHYGISQKRLQDMNGLDNSRIQVGQKLAVIDVARQENSIDYVVSIGDTLSEIAERFSVKLGDITDSEGDLPTSDTIHPGQTLKITIQPLDAG